MATIQTTHAAAALQQIVTRLFSLTWVTGDTTSVTIGDRVLIVTLGTTQTATGMAAAVAAAFNASSRSDNVDGAASSCNFGGQEFGEFAGITASSSGATLKFTGNTAGEPHTIGVTVVTAGDGIVASEVVVQAATGPEFWNSGANWSGDAVPANDDVTQAINTIKGPNGRALGFKYGLPTALEVTIKHYSTYEGQWGLPPVNESIPGKPYNEYRQQYIQLTADGTGTNILHEFGIGPGNGSPLMNIRHDTLKCSPVVHNTGRPVIPGGKALNIVCAAATSELTILKGSVNAASQFGATAGWNVINVATSQGQGTDLRIAGADASWALNVSGGSVFVENTVGMTLTQYGGAVECIGTTAAAAANVYGGALKWNGSGTLTALTIDNLGDFDARNGMSAFIVTNCTRRSRQSFLRDPFHRATFSNPIQNYGGVDGLDFGSNFSLTPAAI
jgi:hypothetical protein